MRILLINVVVDVNVDVVLVGIVFVVNIQPLDVTLKY